MKLTSFILIFLGSILISHAKANIHRIKFSVNSPGTAPYIYYDINSDKFEGVVVDFFATLEESGDFVVDYLDSNRARAEELLSHRVADVFLSSSIWLEQPKNYIYSNTFMHHNSYMYSTFAFNQAFNPNQSEGALICARRNYKYPVMSKYFDNNIMVRVDSTSQDTMVLMLAKGRCDFAIMSDDNAKSIMSTPEFCDTEFYQSPNVISAVDITFVIRPELSELKKQIDEKLAIFISSGKRDKSIQKHTGIQVFPKLQCLN